jgi:hypothetical protein
MAIPEDIVNYMIQISGYDRFVLSTGGSPVIPANIIVDAEKPPTQVDIDFPVKIYDAKAELDGRYYLVTPVSSLGPIDYIDSGYPYGQGLNSSGFFPLPEGEQISTGATLLNLVSFVRYSATTGLVIAKYVSGVFLTGGETIAGLKSGASSTADAPTAEVYYVVPETPLVTDDFPHPRYVDGATYLIGDKVRHTYTPTNFGSGKRQVITSASKHLLNLKNNSKQDLVYEALANTTDEPSPASGDWKQIGISDISDRSRGFHGSTLSYESKLIIDSVTYPSDLDQVSVVANGVPVDIDTIDGSLGFVYPTAADLVLKSVTKSFVGDGEQVVFNMGGPIVDAILGLPTTVPGDLSLPSVTPGGITITAVDGETGDVTLSAAPDSFDITYNAGLGLSVKEIASRYVSDDTFLVSGGHLLNVSGDILASGISDADEIEVYVDDVLQTNDGSVYTIDDPMTGTIKFDSTGVAESAIFVAQDASTLASAGTGDYIEFHTAANTYWIWFLVDGATTAPPTTTETLIQVTVASTDLASAVATAIDAAIVGASPADFSSSLSAPQVTLTNTAVGDVADATAGTTGWAAPTITQGDAVNIIAESSVVRVTYKHLPSTAVGDSVLISYRSGVVTQWTGDIDGPIIGSVDFDTGTKKLTINRNGGTTDFLDIEDDPTRVIIHAPTISPSRPLRYSEQSFEVDSRLVNVIDADTIEIPNMPGLEDNNEIWVTVIASSLKSNRYTHIFPVDIEA